MPQSVPTTNASALFLVERCFPVNQHFVDLVVGMAPKSSRATSASRSVSVSFKS